MNPLWMLSYLPNMPASHIAIFNDLRGPNNSLTMREASGLMAIREAVQTIERGHADRMIAGATGTRIHSFKTVHAMQHGAAGQSRAAAAEASRPFDADRTGMVVGEGAGAILLEEFEAAQARGATIYGEVLGTGEQRRGGRRTLERPPRAVALANAARAALGVGAAERRRTSATSTPMRMGTTAGDAEEAAALARRVRTRDAARDSGRRGEELLRQPRRGQRRGRDDRQRAGAAPRAAVPDAELRDAGSGVSGRTWRAALSRKRRGRAS